MHQNESRPVLKQRARAGKPVSRTCLSALLMPLQYNAMAKKKLPKVLALLDEDMCTGCEACMTVCPVDCISVVPGPRHELAFQVCTIDLPRCIGCTLCHQVCPWDCITMIPTDQFLQNTETAKQLT